MDTEKHVKNCSYTVCNTVPATKTKKVTYTVC